MEQKGGCCNKLDNSSQARGQDHCLLLCQEAYELGGATSKIRRILIIDEKRSRRRRSSKVEGEKEGEEGPLLTEEGATDSSPL